MINEMISFCGIVCSDCPAYRLTQADDREGLAALARRMTELGQPRTADEMRCDGCLTRSGRLVPYCRECPARRCGQERELKNCAFCGDFGCERITEVWSIIIPQDARPRLEALHRKLHGQGGPA